MRKENEVISVIVNNDNLSNNINDIKETNKDISKSLNNNNNVNEEEKENKDLEVDKNDNLNSNHIEEKNNELPLNKNEGEVMKEKNSLNIKPKGYVRIFRKYIKKKGQIMNNIIENRLRLWEKIILKDLTFKKKILVRISVSKEKDRKSKSYRAAKLNAGKKNLNNIKIINQNEFLGLNDISEIKPTKFKRIFVSNNKEINNKTYNKPQNKKYNINNTVGNNSSTHNKYKRFFENNKQSNNNKNKIDNKVIKYNKNRRNPLIEISDEKPKKDQFKNIRNDYKKNINLKNKFNKIEISKNNSEHKSEFNSSKLKNIYKSYSVYNKNNNKNESNNNSKDYHLKYAKNYNNTITLPPKKTQNKFNSKEKQYLSPYSTKKYIPQKKIYSEKKEKEYNSFFLKKFQNKNNVIKPIKLNIRDININNYQYLNCTTRRAKLDKDENSFVDKKTLKRGITSVIQHFSGKIETFLNYDKSTSKSKKIYLK
jgi:hypothetical protein